MTEAEQERARVVASGRRYHINGTVYVLPLCEAKPRCALKIGRFAVGAAVKVSSFGLGIDILKAGVLVQIGPVLVWVAHIEKQIAAVDALARDHLKGVE